MSFEKALIVSVLINEKEDEVNYQRLANMFIVSFLLIQT